MIKPVQIDTHLIGNYNPCFIIAEAGVNHNGNIHLAHQLIDNAVAAGADAVKFQAYTTEAVITAKAAKARYQVETTGEADSQYAMLKALELSAEQQKELKAHCDQSGIIYLCTPYDDASLDLLDQMGVAAIKIASTDTTNVPFLRKIAGKGRPVLLSTGMSTLGEVEQAMAALQNHGLTDKVVILHCTAEYPAPVNELNLRAIPTLQQAFQCPVGFSDHTPGVGASPWAVALGACVVEKHFTMDRGLPGPDHRASLVPGELAALVDQTRSAEAALGDGVKRPMPSELLNKQMMQKSLVAARSINEGQLIGPGDLTCKRPATGLPPIWFDRIVGKRARRFISADQQLDIMDVHWGKP